MGPQSNARCLDFSGPNVCTPQGVGCGLINNNVPRVFM